MALITFGEECAEQSEMSDTTMPFNRTLRQQPTPPYLSFLRLKAFFQSIRQAGLPDRLDLEWFEAVATAERRQLQSALHFLGLIDTLWRPTNALRTLAAAYGTDTWPSELSALLRQAYLPLLASGLPLTTVEDVALAFRQVYEGTEDVLRKSRTFFLHAAHEADIDLDPAIFTGIKPRSSSSRRQNGARGHAPNRQEDWSGYRKDPEPLDSPHAVSPKLSAALLELWDPRRMSAEEEKAVQIVLKYCKRLGL